MGKRVGHLRVQSKSPARNMRERRLAQERAEALKNGAIHVTYKFVLGQDAVHISKFDDTVEQRCVIPFLTAKGVKPASIYCQIMTA